MSDNPLLNLNPDDLAGMSLQNLESLEQVFSKGLIGKTLLWPEALQGLLACNETDLQADKWWYNSIIDLIERVDMRKAIVYASVHHGNTDKIVKSIAEECQVDIENRTTIYKKENEKNHFYLL